MMTTLLCLFKHSINGFESLEDTDWLALPVLNGWIVGVDLGEWGGKVIWYSRDGRKRMEVSSDQIRALIRTADGLFAIRLDGFRRFVFAEQSDRHSPRTKWNVADTGSVATA